MLFAAMEAPRARTSLLLLALLAGALASCSSNSDNPVVPPGNDGHPSNVRMVTVVGTPHVKVDFRGALVENADTGTLGGSFLIFFTDSFGRRPAMDGVSLGGVPMHEVIDANNNASYTLDSAELPVDFEIGDTLLFVVAGPDEISPPFSFVIIPSHVVMPADSSVIHQGVDMTLPFTGIVERVLITFTDSQGKNIRYNLQLDNYSGQTSVFIRGSDLSQLKDGPLTLGSNMRDVEKFVVNDYLQSLELTTTQIRELRLDP